MFRALQWACFPHQYCLPTKFSPATYLAPFKPLYGHWEGHTNHKVSLCLEKNWSAEGGAGQNHAHWLVVLGGKARHAFVLREVCLLSLSRRQGRRWRWLLASSRMLILAVGRDAPSWQGQQHLRCCHNFPTTPYSARGARKVVVCSSSVYTALCRVWSSRCRVKLYW